MKKRKKASSNGVHEVEVMKIDDVQRLTLLRIDAELRAAKSTITLKQGVLQSLLKQIDPEGKVAGLQNDINQLQQSVQAHQSALKSACEEIGKKFGIKMNEYVFDTETGVLTSLAELKAKADVRKPGEGKAPPPKSDLN